MYDFNFELPFSLGLNLETIAFVLNIGIPIIYLANFVFLFIKLRSMDKDAPFYTFIKSIVYFFLFYGLGALYFVWFDFFYMDFTSPNPIDIFFGTVDSPPIEVVHMWKIGILLQNVGLLLMVHQLRKKVFKGKKQYIPIIWEAIGITSIILIGFIPIPNPYFWAEVNFLFNFAWSISLPLTYGYIYKNAAGKMKKYAFILFLCFMIYGLAWGFRTRFAVYLFIAIFSGLGSLNPFTYEIIWTIRALAIVINLGLVLGAYQKLMKEF